MIKKLNWMIEMIKTAELEIVCLGFPGYMLHFSVRPADSFILANPGFWAFVWRWDRVTPLGWRCARKWWPTTSSDGFHAHPGFFEAIETWNRQNPPQITFFFFEAFFFVLNQRWCEQWKNGQLGCFGLYRGVHFGYIWDHHTEWETVKSHECESFTPAKTNMTMEHPPWMKMYFLLEMGISS